jgi:hypothetical protein
MMTPGLGATRIRMRSLTGRLVRLAFAAGIVSLCASGIAAARDPAAPYLGMTKAQILACAGEPHSRFKSGKLDLLGKPRLRERQAREGDLRA